MGVVAYLALIVAIPALLLGHQGQDFPLARACRWVAAWRTRRRSRVSRAAVTPLRPSQRRSEPQPRPAPSWARKDAA